MARLLEVMQSEEEVFWTLVQLMEVILPFDQYPNLLGISVDIKVFERIMQEKLPKLCAHLGKFEFNIHFLVTKWFICLFVNHLPLDVELMIWDFFMIKGTCVLFRAALQLFVMMENDLRKVKDICEIQSTVFNFVQQVTRESLVKCLGTGITNAEVDLLRQQ